MKRRGRVLPIPFEIAKEFVREWHYSHRLPMCQHHAIGWFIPGAPRESNLFGETLYAVGYYGVGVNPHQAKFLSELTGWPVTPDNLVELLRQCRSEPKRDGYPLTNFMARCFEQLVGFGYEYVIAFSDPNFGHTGGIYKAANFTHLGQTATEWHVVDAAGEIRHRRYVFRYARRKGLEMKEAREELGLQRIQTLPKDRWILRIAKGKIHAAQSV